MKIDTTAAAIEAAAKAHAAETMRETGALWTRARIRARLETAFIAGHSAAKIDTVQATDTLLASFQGGPRG